MTVPATTIYFATYENLKSSLHNTLGPYWTPFLSGSMARVFTATLSSPLELLRTFLQSKKDPMRIRELLGQLNSFGGVKRLWVGWTPTLLRDVPFSAIYWTFYEEILRRTVPTNSTPKFRDNFTAGVISGSVAAVATLPCDVIKTRMQMQIDDLTFLKKPMSIRETVRQLIAEEGYRGFLKGAVPRAFRVAPACAVMISCYEFFKLQLMDYITD